MSTSNVTTPHAAVLIWNYNDRITSAGATQANISTISELIISTVSLRQINTSKSKSQPDGAFSFVLAPTRNWIEAITPGSWCVILMGNTPITKQDFTNADRKHVKMIGKIETVRADVQVNEEGARMTTFNVSGVDWGHIFNNILYVDPLLARPSDPKNLGNPAFIALRNALFGSDGASPEIRPVYDNLNSILSIFGIPLGGDFDPAGKSINRLAKAIYNFVIPTEMQSYFKFVKKSGKNSYPMLVSSNKINEVLTLQTGRLTSYGKYDETAEALGYIDSFSLQGTNTFWQILLENSNPTLNEMFCEIVWDDQDPTSNDIALTIFNRIKPFSFNDNTQTQPTITDPPTADQYTLNNLRSFFSNVPTHYIQDVEHGQMLEEPPPIDPVNVISINAGTNWRDKYNFIEIKPQFQEFKVLDVGTKQKTQNADEISFQREGFRPMMVGSKQLPYNGNKQNNSSDFKIDFDLYRTWTALLREWYFDTHRMLNGTIVLHGVDEYIAVGDNIRFDAGFINPTPNINQATVNAGKNQYILAHIESVSHSFGLVNGDARTYTTTIQFVRGVIVNDQNVRVGDGALDEFTTSVLVDTNDTNVFGNMDADTPGGAADTQLLNQALNGGGSTGNNGGS